MSSTSQSDHVFLVVHLNINLRHPIAIENDFINNCHTNFLIPLINKPTPNANNNPSILDHISTNQLYDAFNGIFLLDITDHYPIVTIAPINCPQKRIRVKFRDHSGQNLTKLKIEVEHYFNNHVRINQDVSASTNNFCRNLFGICCNCCPIKEIEIYLTRLHRFLMLFWFRCIVNMNNFDSIRMTLLPLIIIILLKTISQLLYVMLEIIISIENSQSSRIIQGTPGRL